MGKTLKRKARVLGKRDVRIPTNPPTEPGGLVIRIFSMEKKIQILVVEKINKYKNLINGICKYW